MKLTQTELLEKINNLNKKKPIIKEGKEIQRATFPADADALEQHEEAIKQNKERLDPKNQSAEVKALIKDTASEESRYSHFDVVDRKDLAKRINEAKKNGLTFKVSRSQKEGFRYDFKVLNEDYLKKDAGDPDVNCSAFNKATTINSLSESTKEEPNDENIEKDVEIKDLPDTFEGKIDFLLEDEEEAIEGYDNVIAALSEDEDLENVVSQLETIRDEEIAHKEFLQQVKEDINATYNVAVDPEDIITDDDVEELDDEPLNEELKVYTSTLDGFHPSKNAEIFWQDIVDNNKVEDLEYALEELYPDGISDVALDDLLVNEEDWIRDIIDLQEVDDDVDTEDDDYDTEDTTPIDFDEDDLEDVSDTDDDMEEDSDEDYIDLDDEEPIAKPDASEDDDIEEYTEDEDEDEDEDTDSKDKDSKDDDKDDDSDEDKTDRLADGFINKQFKATSTLTEDEKLGARDLATKQEMATAQEDDEEVVDIDDDCVDNMLGCPKAPKE